MGFGNEPALEDEFVLVPPQAAGALGAFATRVRSSVLLAADSFTEGVKEKSSTFSDTVSENATVVKNKSIEVAENVKEKSVGVADSMKKGVVAVAENVQGILAPKTVKREGILAKQVNGNKWEDYYFVLRGGSVLVLPTQGAEKAEVSITLDCVSRAEPLDVLVTGRPFCFRVTLVLQEKTAVVNNWSFFGVNSFTSNRVYNQEIDIVLQAANEEDMKGWVRELYSTSSGLALQEHLKKTGQGAMRFAEATGVYTFVGTLTGLVGYRAGRNVANKIIT